MNRRKRLIEWLTRNPAIGLPVVVICMLILAVILAVTLQAVGVLGYQDIQIISTPGNPVSGYLRFFGTPGALNCLTSGGANCLPGFANPMTTKGDIIVGGASGAPSRLAVGTNAYCVTANSSATYGVDWEACGAGTTVTVASGTSALGTSSISSGACASTVTTTATGVASTDNIQADFNASPLSTTGYEASSSGMLTIIKWPTSGDVNFAVCNNTGSSITPGAVTLNWRVVR
jgi:hypothetical protein